MTGNPFQMMMQMMGGNGNPFMAMQQQQMPQNNFMNGLPQLNPQQFQQMLPSISDMQLQQLANQAQAQGMSVEQINQGLQFIRGLKK